MMFLNTLFVKMICLYLSKQSLKGQKMEIISFKVEKNQSIDIRALLLVLNAFSQATSQYIKHQSGEYVRLELQSVEKGSDIFNLVLVGGGLFLASGEIVKVINDYLNLFLSLKHIKEASVQSIKDDTLLSREFVENLDCVATFINNKDISQVTISREQKSIILNKENTKSIKESLEIIKDIKGYKSPPIQRIYENMIIEFYQTTNTQKDIKDKAFCYEITDKPIPTLITDENLKKIVLDNPYSYRFLVDLEVYKNANGKILNFRAFNFRDKILKEE